MYPFVTQQLFFSRQKKIRFCRIIIKKIRKSEKLVSHSRTQHVILSASGFKNNNNTVELIFLLFFLLPSFFLMWRREPKESGVVRQKIEKKINEGKKNEKKNQEKNIKLCIYSQFVLLCLFPQYLFHIRMERYKFYSLYVVFCMSERVGDVLLTGTHV